MEIRESERPAWNYKTDLLGHWLIKGPRSHEALALFHFFLRCVSACLCVRAFIGMSAHRDDVGIGIPGTELGSTENAILA